MAVRKKKRAGSAPKLQTSKPAQEQTPSTRRVVTHHEIAARAYLIWEASGRQHGNDRAQWLQAERELRG